MKTLQRFTTLRSVRKEDEALQYMCRSDQTTERLPQLQLEGQVMHRKKRIAVSIITMVLMLVAVMPNLAIAYSPGEEVRINFPVSYLPYNTTNVSFAKTGGQVLVSNAPETINENGATRVDGSKITGQYNATLYRDIVSGPFRFWASHYNKTTHPLTFWLYFKNTSGKEVNLYKTLEAYDDAYVTVAASKVTKQFMDSSPNPTLLATIPANGSYYFAISDQDHVAIQESMVYFAEFSAVAASDGSNAGVLVSHVVTDDTVNDPTPYATTNTIARTNATATTSDDYRGLLDHWGRVGTIDITLTDQNPFTGIRLSDLGYNGEQEKLMTRWDVSGNAVEQREVRFITPTLNKLRLAYWYTDYKIDVNITNQTRYPAVHTLYGSNSSNPGFINYQLNGGPALNYHFSRNTAVPVTVSNSYQIRTMVMPSASLPFGLYFAAGSPAAVPNELPVVKAEMTLLQLNVNQARTLVNALPAGAEKTSLLQRLDVVQQIIAAANQVGVAESALSGFEQVLQASDLSIQDSKKREAELERLQTALQPVEEQLSKANALIAALPVSDQTAVLQHIANLKKRAATVGGTIQSIEAIIEEARKPMQQGNGNEESRIKVSLGSTVNLLEEFHTALIDQLHTTDGIKWLSFDRSIAAVGSNGSMSAIGNGVVQVIGYNDQGIFTFIAVINKKD